MQRTPRSTLTATVAVSVALHGAAWVAIAVGYPSWMWTLVFVAFWLPLAVLAVAVAVTLGRRVNRHRVPAAR